MQVSVTKCLLVMLVSTCCYAQNKSTFNILQNALDDFVSDYRTEAAAVFDASSSITKRQLLIGFTQLLKEFRQSLNDISARVANTNAKPCVSSTTYNLTDVTTYPRGIIEQVQNLSRVSYSIAVFYVNSFISCTSATLNRINTNLNRIPAVYKALAQIIRNGGIYITPCRPLRAGSYSPSINQTAACLEHYKNSIQRFRTIFLNAINGDVIKGENLTEPGYIENKELFSIPNCLLYASDDALKTGNILLEDITKCAKTLGETVVSNQILLQKQIPHIQAQLNSLENFYGNKSNTTSEIFRQYARLAFIDLDLEEGQKFGNRSQVVDDVYVQAADRVNGVASRMDNGETRDCLESANTYLKENILDSDFALRECAKDLTNQAATFLRVNNEVLRVGKNNVNIPESLPKVTQCLSNNLFNSDTYSECYNSINLTKLEINNQINVRLYFAGDSIEYNCKKAVYQPVLALDMLNNCGA